MNTFTNKGIVFEYETMGEGTPFLFLHGLGGGIGQIKGTFIETPGIQLITINQQGHGGSGVSWDTFGFDALADDAVALLDHLGIETAVIGGISMGAAVSVNIAVRYPERVKALLLIRNAWTCVPMAPDRILAYADMGRCLQEGGEELFKTTGGWDIVREPSAYTRNAFLLPFGEEPNIRNWQKFCILPSMAPIPDEKCLEKIKVPVHIGACRNDFCHPYGYGVWYHEKIAGSVLTEIPDKDTDGKRHKQMINDVIKELIIGR